MPPGKELCAVKGKGLGVPSFDAVCAQKMRPRSAAHACQTHDQPNTPLSFPRTPILPLPVVLSFLSLFSLLSLAALFSRPPLFPRVSSLSPLRPSHPRPPLSPFPSRRLPFNEPPDHNPPAPLPSSSPTLDSFMQRPGYHSKPTDALFSSDRPKSTPPAPAYTPPLTSSSSLRPKQVAPSPFARIASSLRGMMRESKDPQGRGSTADADADGFAPTGRSKEGTILGESVVLRLSLLALARVFSSSRPAHLVLRHPDGHLRGENGRVLAMLLAEGDQRRRGASPHPHASKLSPSSTVSSTARFDLLCAPSHPRRRHASCLDARSLARWLAHPWPFLAPPR